MTGENRDRAGERGEVAAADCRARDEIVDEQIIGGVTRAFDRDAPRRAVAASRGIRGIDADLRQVVVDDKDRRCGQEAHDVSRIRLNGDGRRLIAFHEQIVDGVDRQENKILPRRDGDDSGKGNEIHTIARHAADRVANVQCTVVGRIDPEEGHGRAVSARFNRVRIERQDADLGLRIWLVIPFNAQRGLGPG